MAKGDVQSALQLYLQEIHCTPLLTAEEERELSMQIRRGDAAAARDRMIRANLRLVVAIAKRYARCGFPLGDLIEEGNLGLMRAVESYDPEVGARFSTYASWWIKQSIRRAMNGLQPVRVPGYMVELVNRLKRTGRELERRLGRPPTLAELGQAMELPAKRLRAVRSAARASQRGDLAARDDLDRYTHVTESLADDRTPPPDSVALLRDDVEALRRTLGAMDGRDASILRLRYGLDGQEPMTLREVGHHIGLTRERVRQLELAALHKLQDRLSRPSRCPALASGD